VRARVIGLLRSAFFKIIGPSPRTNRRRGWFPDSPKMKFPPTRAENDAGSLPEDLWIALRCLEFPIEADCARSRAMPRPNQTLQSLQDDENHGITNVRFRSLSLSPPLDRNDPRARLERMPQCESANRSERSFCAMSNERREERVRGGGGGRSESRVLRDPR